VTAARPRPRCDSCRQPMPWHPPQCTCGHPDNGHHETSGGNTTYCCIYDHGAACGCPRYEHATDGYYGPLVMAS
jgi:hypothetical protein